MKVKSLTMLPLKILFFVFKNSIGSARAPNDPRKLKTVKKFEISII